MCILKMGYYFVKEKWSNDTCYNMDERWRHDTKWKKWATEYHVLYVSIYMKYPEETNL